MSLTRRDFARTVGLGTVGMLSSPFIIGRGHEAAAFEPPLVKGLERADIIRISSNENARGPGPSAMAALHQSISVRAGRGYPADNTTELVTAIAEQFGVDDANVVIGTRIDRAAGWGGSCFLFPEQGAGHRVADVRHARPNGPSDRCTRHHDPRRCLAGARYPCNGSCLDRGGPGVLL